MHINALELSVPLIFLRNHGLSLQGKSLAFRMDNTVAINCIQKQGSARSRVLQALSEELFLVADSLDITIQALYLPGTANLWADALSRGQSTAVEWMLDRSVFHHRIELPFSPQINLFASHQNHLLAEYLTRFEKTGAGGPDALSEDWNR